MKYSCVDNALLVYVSAVLTTYAQGQHVYYTPEELEIPGYTEAIDTTGENIPMLLTYLYPIGWSKDGKFAYISLFDDHGDAYGYVNFDFVIRNHRTGEVFFSHADEQDEFPSDTPLDTIWSAHNVLFDKALEQNGIKQFKFKLSEFPVRTPTDTVDCRLSLHEVDIDSSPYGFPGIDSLVLSMESRKYGTQVIYSDTGYIGLGASVPGYLDDPYGNGIIILLILSHWGWEGPPNTTTIRLLYCLLR
jgi:hypothetical protein